MRALPADPEIENLDPDVRARVAALWRSRADSELGAAETFRRIARALEELDADPALIALATRGVQDELGHAELCHEVAARYAGASPPAPAARPHAYPEFTGPPAVRALLLVIANCCFNETTATAYLQLCQRDAEGPLVREVLRRLLADDVDHARLGWSFLASNLAATPALAPVLSAQLASLLAMNFNTWHHGKALLGEAPRHGCPTRADVDAMIIDVSRELILPGFDRAGLDISAARAWLAEKHPS
jgi:hypothetical protein